jgi:DNA-3-methyladenine glycosylase I
MSKTVVRCPWSGNDPLYIKYHDEEWGLPVHDDRKLFEFLLLEGFQAGLSWRTILYKRENFRNAFDNFDAEIIARYGKRKINALLKDEGIIRNKLKVNAAVTNAQAYLKILDKYDSFARYMWQFTDGKVVKNERKEMGEIPAKTKQSDWMSKTLLRDGFKFVGSTICYANMQATGMVNDHLVTCFRYDKV